MADVWPPLLERESGTVGRALSLDEWVRLDEEDGELVDGRLVEEEVPDAVHELAVSWLIRVIGAWLGERGFVFGSELKLVVAERTGRKPDVVVFLPGAPAPPRHGPLVEPPSLIVEVVSPLPRDERRDRVLKMSEYAKFGVRYYWLVDPALGTFEIFERTPSGFTQVIAATGGRIDAVPGCAELALDVDALWRELARLRKS